MQRKRTKVRVNRSYHRSYSVVDTDLGLVMLEGLRTRVAARREAAVLNTLSGTDAFRVVSS